MIISRLDMSCHTNRISTNLALLYSLLVAEGRARSISQLQLCNSIASRLSQGTCIVTLLVIEICISKSQVLDGEMCLVSEEAIVFAPFSVIRITVTLTSYICACAFYPDCALTALSCCSVPIGYFDGIR